MQTFLFSGKLTAYMDKRWKKAGNFMKAKENLLNPLLGNREEERWITGLAEGNREPLKEETRRAELGLLSVAKQNLKWCINFFQYLGVVWTKGQSKDTSKCQVK